MPSSRASSRWLARPTGRTCSARSILPARPPLMAPGRSINTTGSILIPRPRYHHIGLYAHRGAALARFVALPPSPLELREKLEQLRALEAGMRIDVKRVDALPMSVDTPADLEKVRAAVAASAGRSRLIA